MFKVTDDTLCVVNTYKMHIYTFCTEKSAQDELRKAEEQRQASIRTWEKHIENFPDSAAVFQSYLESDRKSAYEVMTHAEFVKREREKLLSGVPEEIDEEKFYEMLDVLPPDKWTRRDGVEMFCMAERWTGTYSTQYAHDHISGKFYSKMVDVADESTWINTFLR